MGDVNKFWYGLDIVRDLVCLLGGGGWIKWLDFSRGLMMIEWAKDKESAFPKIWDCCWGDIRD